MERIDKVIEIGNGRKFLLESDFVVNGLRCVVMGIPLGHRCGYVAIPKTHKFYGVSYDELYDLEVHGGLTYSDYTYNNYPVESDNNTWWIGFDCGHYMDGTDLELMKQLLSDSDYNNLLEIEKMYNTNKYGTVRTNDYVITELIGLTNQINNI